MDGAGYCSANFKGPECKLCVEDDHRLVDREKCKACPRIGAVAGRLLALWLGLGAACGLLAWVYSQHAWRRLRGIGPPLKFVDLVLAKFSALGIQPKLKILFGFYQICTVLEITYSARLPPKYMEWTDPLRVVTGIDWSGLVMPSQCVSYSLRLLFIAFSPVALIALLLLAGVLLRLKWWRALPAPRPRLGQTVLLGLLDYTPLGLIVVFCFVPSVSASIFKAWSCQAYTSTRPDAPLEVIAHMRQDPRVQCYVEGGDHGSICQLGLFLALLWPLGSLVLYAGLLIMCYMPLTRRTPSALTRATAFLHRDYDLQFYR
jgi:hypothetical protein